MNKLYLLPLLTLISLTAITPSQSETNHFGTGGVFHLDLDDSKMPFTQKEEREQKLLEEQLRMKTNETKQTQ
tara:strand:+ start:29 stop:244 length:216 start_codon:yes stop_codon:yes gene_type:complete